MACRRRFDIPSFAAVCLLNGGKIKIKCGNYDRLTNANTGCMSQKKCDP